MTNDRFVDPEDHDRHAPTHPDISTHDVDPEAYRTFRIPKHVDLARIRYRRDPVFHEAVNVAYRRLDGTATPEDVFAEYPGRRLRVSKNLLGELYYGGDVEPFVDVVFDDRDLDAFADWVDDPASAFATREDPEWLTGAKVSVSDDTADTIDEAVEAWRNGDVRKAELDAFVGDMVDADPVEDTSTDAEPGGSDPKTPSHGVEMSWREVAYGIAFFVALLILIVGAIHYFGV